MFEYSCFKFSTNIFRNIVFNTKAKKKFFQNFYTERIQKILIIVHFTFSMLSISFAIKKSFDLLTVFFKFFALNAQNLLVIVHFSFSMLNITFAIKK
jgi:hypothetical protein